jgi:hypothetical protein
VKSIWRLTPPNEGLRPFTQPQNIFLMPPQAAECEILLYNLIFLHNPTTYATAIRLLPKTLHQKYGHQKKQAIFWANCSKMNIFVKF